jgi:L-methionine (R)-S-oxide reductase
MELMSRIMSAPSETHVLQCIISHFGADSGTIHLLGEDGNLHLLVASDGMPEPVLETIRTIPVGKGMAGLAVERRAPVDSCNIQTDATGDVRPGARATNLAGAIVVPIFRDGKVVGALGIANRAERTFTPAEIEELMEAGRQIAERQ